MNQQPIEKNPADRQVEEVLLSRLAVAPGLGDVHALVSDGVATITGRVRDEVDLLRVDKIASSVPGISQVKNTLTVDPEIQLDERPELEAPDLETSNLGDSTLNHPTVDTRTESLVPGVAPGSVVDVEHFAPVEGVPGALPVTGDPASVMDAGAVDAMKVSGGQRTADDMAFQIIEGMDVLDSEGKKVGKVKTIRQTDFLLSRTLARNYYVPYFECSLEEDHVRFNKVKVSELGDQGWAFPT